MYTHDQKGVLSLRPRQQIFLLGRKPVFPPVDCLLVVREGKFAFRPACGPEGQHCRPCGSSCQVAQEDREGTGALNQLGPPLVNNKTRTGFPFLLPTQGRADGPLAWPWTPESPVVSCWSSSYERVQSSQRVRKTGFPSAPRTMNWPFRGRSPRGVPCSRKCK